MIVLRSNEPFLAAKDDNMRRRDFLKTLGALGGSACLGQLAATSPPSPPIRFKLGAISDGFSRDFEEALKIMKSYDLSWVEVRNVWGIYNTEASPAQVQRMKDLLEQYYFKVSVVDTALFKCALPGAPPARNQRDAYPYAEQMDLLKRGMERAHALGTDKVRIFAFWRVAQPEEVYPRVADELTKAAAVARSAGIRLVLEDEGSCNVGTGHELAKMLALAPAPNLGANWDVGNPTWHGEASFPDGYAALDKKRIWHLHIKGVKCEAGFKGCRETFTDQGQLDLLGQLRALAHDGYQETMSLECEFSAPGMSHLETAKRSLEGLIKIAREAST